MGMNQATTLPLRLLALGIISPSEESVPKLPSLIELRAAFSGLEPHHVYTTISEWLESLERNPEEIEWWEKMKAMPGEGLLVQEALCRWQQLGRPFLTWRRDNDCVYSANEERLFFD